MRPDRALGAEPVAQELELDRRPHAGVPDEPAAGARSAAAGQRAAALPELLRTCDECRRHPQLIVDKFPIPKSDYVNERFVADWKPDHGWGWQQNRAIVGHNLKIAWNLTRVRPLLPGARPALPGRRPRQEATDYDEQLASDASNWRGDSPSDGRVGLDKLRGGCFDCRRAPAQRGMPASSPGATPRTSGSRSRRILAYLILHGVTPDDPRYLDLAREMLGVLEPVLPRPRPAGLLLPRRPTTACRCSRATTPTRRPPDPATTPSS